MKNKPNIIYLQLGLDSNIEDFKKLSDVTWSADKIYSDDLQFISSYFILAEIDKLKDYANATDDYEKAEFAINALKNLIK